MFVFHLCISIINGLSSLTSIVSNAFVFLAIVKTPSLHKPANVLLCSLAASDFAVGLIVQPLFIADRLMSDRKMKLPLWYSRIFFIAVSFTTLALISLDRFLALHWHLRYPVMVTVKRIRYTVVLVWISIAPLVQFYFNADGRKMRQESTITFFTAISFVILFCHFKIYKIIQYHRRQIAAHLQALQVPTPRQGRSIRTMWYIQGLYVICVLPILCISVAARFSIKKDIIHVVQNVSWTILFIKSSLNPYLYCYRSAAIKNVVLSMVNRCLRKKNATEIELGKGTELKTSCLNIRRKNNNNKGNQSQGIDGRIASEMLQFSGAN